jgi:hypothetical protein
MRLQPLAVGAMPGFSGIPGMPGLSGVPGRPGYGAWSDLSVESAFSE